MGGTSKGMFRPLGRVYSWMEEDGFEGKCEVFTRTGGLFMLLSGVSAFEGPDVRNCSVIFGTGNGLESRRFVAIPSSESVCGLSPQQ